MGVLHLNGIGYDYCLVGATLLNIYALGFY